MTDSERFVMVLNILNENGFESSGLYHNMFKKLSDEELTDNDKVQDILKIISEYEERCDNPISNYPEQIIIRYLRQRISLGLDEFETSSDTTIKDWIKDIYNIDLDP